MSASEPRPAGDRTAADPAASDPAALDAVLTVLARHARDLAPLGPVRLGVGAVTVELGAVAAPADPLPAGAPHLAAVPDTVVPAPVPDRPATPAPAVDPAPAASAGPTVCSTTVGVFYRSSEPGSAPFVAEGDTIAVGQQIGIVEAMKLMIPLESDRAGRVEAVLVADGEAVEHGQPVLRLAAG